MQKAKDLFINKILKKKRYWIPLLIVVIIAVYLLLRPSSAVKNTVTDFAKYSDLKETVLATGQVISDTDLNLSFNSGGTAKSIKVKVGDKVKQGDILATLDQGQAQANLTSARGSLAAANARYKRVLEGSTSEDVALSQITLDQTKITEQTIIDNAYQTLLNSIPEAVPADGTSAYTAPTISGTYSLGKEGSISLSTYYSSGGKSFIASGLVDYVGLADSVTPQPLGNSGLYIKFPTNYYDIGINNWVINIPNKKAANYLLNYNAYQTAKAGAKSAIDQSAAALAIKKAGPRSSDIDLALADITTAEGQVEQATVAYNNTMIIAPADGTITSVDIKAGELASALSPVITLQDVSNIYIEANINEANIASLSIGMPIDITFDAFGTDKIFKGNITKIDPSSTLVSGVVNYKIRVSVEKVDNLRPGMTANMTIKVAEKDHIIAIPIRAILEDSAGNKTLRIITNTNTKKYKEVKITTGMEGDGGLAEVTSGIKENDEFVVLIKTN